MKIAEFDAAFKGEMELYLRYLEKHETVEGENTPIGLILCTGKNEEHVELLQLDKSNIRVADYLTALPPRETFEAKGCWPTTANSEDHRPTRATGKSARSF